MGTSTLEQKNAALEAIAHDMGGLIGSVRTLLSVIKGLEYDERALLEAIANRLEQLQQRANAAKK